MFIPLIANAGDPPYSKDCLHLRGSFKFTYTWKKPDGQPTCGTNPPPNTTVTETQYIRNSTGGWTQIGEPSQVSSNDMEC